jgi:hypothetical protein
MSETQSHACKQPRFAGRQRGVTGQTSFCLCRGARDEFKLALKPVARLYTFYRFAFHVKSGLCDVVVDIVLVHARDVHDIDREH